MSDGNFTAAVENFVRAAETAADPFYTQFSKLGLGLAYLMKRQYQDAEEAAEQVSAYSREYGGEIIGVVAEIILGTICVLKGQMSRNVRMLEVSSRQCLEQGIPGYHLIAELMLGMIYADIILGQSEVGTLAMVKNLGFILKNVPAALKKTEEHLNRVRRIGVESGYTGYAGLAMLTLGRVYQFKKKQDRAKEMFSEAAANFAKCKAGTFLKIIQEETDAVVD